MGILSFFVLRVWIGTTFSWSLCFYFIRGILFFYRGSICGLVMGFAFCTEDQHTVYGLLFPPSCVLVGTNIFLYFV